MNLQKQIHFITPTSTVSLTKLSTCPKLINQKSIAVSIHSSTTTDYVANDKQLSLGHYLAKSIKTSADKYEETTSSHRIIIKSFQNDGFLEIREKFKIDDAEFARSVESLGKYEVSGGKKCKEFWISADEKYILKKIENAEVKFFENNGSFLTDYLYSNGRSLLARLYGVWSVKIYEDEKKIENGFYCLMENVFSGVDVVRKFDLKGSTRNRRAREGKVIWDSDYIEGEEMIRPIETFDFCKEQIMAQLKQDVEFLKRWNVMDYSLIVAECAGGNELKIGVVDYLRSYTWDKALESIVKSYLPENENRDGSLDGSFEENNTTEISKPTILPADEYMNRFLEAIDKYVHVVNFDWE